MHSQVETGVGGWWQSAHVDVTIVTLPSSSLSLSTPQGTLGMSLDMHLCSWGIEPLARWWDGNRKGRTYLGWEVGAPPSWPVNLLLLIIIIIIIIIVVVVVVFGGALLPSSLSLSYTSGTQGTHHWTCPHALKDRRSVGWWHRGQNRGLTWAGGWW